MEICDLYWMRLESADEEKEVIYRLEQMCSETECDNKEY